MPSRHVDYFIRGNEDDYQELWAALGDLQYQYNRIDFRMSDLLEDMGREIQGTEAGDKWKATLASFLEVWNGNNISTWLPNGKDCYLITFARFGQTLETGYAFFEVRRDYKMENVIHTTMEDRLLQIIKDMAAAALSNGIDGHVKALIRYLDKAQQLWQSIKERMAAEDVELGSGGVQLKGYYHRRVAEYDRTTEYDTIGHSVLDILEFKGESTSRFVSAPRLSSTVATRYRHVYRSDGSYYASLPMNSRVETRTELNSVTSNASAAQGCHPSITLC
jgi:hypothetical protein